MTETTEQQQTTPILATTDTTYELHVQTLSGFRVWRDGVEIETAEWKREKSLHLFQFLITVRQQTARMHKEQIIDYLWPEVDTELGNQNFKVALHALNKVLEPKRKPRTDPRFVQRHDLTYSLNMDLIWIDSDSFEKSVIAGNQALAENNIQTATQHYQNALILYQGDYLPERRYEDWSSAERERLQILALGMMTILADLVVDVSPLESIRLTQRVLSIDPIWEDAYRTQMRAYLAQGNRPMAIRTYQQCEEALEKELGISPLPETQKLMQQITNIGQK
ncbi:MAG: transcriptional regulator [Anaerolineaceae bacterium]|nr:transcriptional regulator [Anaerolineaceae bacterium]MCB9100875.1 transcriptional regulator [Anaerolineales bacterium]